MTDDHDHRTFHNMVSPETMLFAAKEQMLNGNDPVTEADWVKVMNFIAFNIHPEVCVSACLIFKIIYDVPIDREHVVAIAEFQNESKAGRA